VNIIGQIRCPHVDSSQVKVCPDNNEPTEARELPYALSSQFLKRSDVKVCCVIFMLCESNPI
jgi:hypothetical protein